MVVVRSVSVQSGVLRCGSHHEELQVESKGQSVEEASLLAATYLCWDELSISGLLNYLNNPRNALK